MLASSLAAIGLLAQVWENPAAGDPAKQMVDGILRYLERQSPKPVKQDLARILGVIDPRAPTGDMELVATLRHPALRASTAGFDAYAVRWPVLDGMTAEGLLLQPKSPLRKRIVAIPDAGMPPERMTAMQREASAGAQVLIPVLIDRLSKWSGNPAIGKTTKLSHREFLYRMSFPMGRHLLGYEIQKALAAVDWFSAQTPGVPIQAIGLGEGAAIAAYAKALDPRIGEAFGAGFAWDRSDVAGEPIDRNVWKIRLAEASPLPPYSFRAGDSAIPPAPDADARMRRQFDEIVRFNQSLIAKSERVRDRLWESTKNKDEIRAAIWDDVFGRIPKSGEPLKTRRKASYDSKKWIGYEIQFDVVGPDVFGYGVLLLPKDLRPGEKRPVVVVQHGLEGRPQDLFLTKPPSREYDTYRDLAGTWADLGYIVYAPQNPYRGDFRTIARLGNPLGLSLYSFILAQYEKMLDFLAALPEADADKIGFYGLSYGGRTALIAPALLPQFKAVVCSGNFNEWIHKSIAIDAPYTYLFTQEYEIFDFGAANVAGHAELAKLIAPRPFLVERGHRDGVGVDEWVSYEYAKVKRYYDENGWRDRVGLAWFNGPHRIDGVEAIPFLRKWIGP
jgi:dienelactone hydrolase